VDNVLRQGRQFRKQYVSVFEWLERTFTDGEFSNSQNAGRSVYKEVVIKWKNKESSADGGSVFGLSLTKSVTLKKLLLMTFSATPV
jgi:alpha-galactosidase